MDFKISSGLQYHLMATDDLVAAINGTVIKIYGDPVSQAAADALIPETANAAIGSATLLCTITVDGNGTALTFDPTPVNGAIYKTASESWYGTNAASGYPSFYRLQLSSDDGTLSTTAIRAQGDVGQLNANLIIGTPYLTSGEQQRVDNYLIGMPLA